MDSTVVSYLDTHVLVYLYQGDVDRLGKRAQYAIESNQLVVSPMAVLELELLAEIGRLQCPASEIITALWGEIGLRVCDIPFRAIAEQAAREKWTRDPFDRLIVANAYAANAQLITKDEKILANYSLALW